MSNSPTVPLTDEGPRQYFADLDEALREFRIPLENHNLARTTLAGFDYGRIYMPAKSRAYLAFEGAGGPPAIAWLHSGFIEVRTAPGKYETTVLPTNSVRMGGGGGTRQERADAQLAPCPSCYITLPATGVCGACY